MPQKTHRSLWYACTRFDAWDLTCLTKPHMLHRLDMLDGARATTAFCAFLVMSTPRGRSTFRLRFQQLLGALEVRGQEDTKKKSLATQFWVNGICWHWLNPVLSWSLEIEPVDSWRWVVPQPWQPWQMIKIHQSDCLFGSWLEALALCRVGETWLEMLEHMNMCTIKQKQFCFTRNCNWKEPAIRWFAAWLRHVSICMPPAYVNVCQIAQIKNTHTNASKCYAFIHLLLAQTGLNSKVYKTAKISTCFDLCRSWNVAIASSSGLGLKVLWVPPFEHRSRP